MSFYSELILAANEGVRPPEESVVMRLLLDLGLIEPARAGQICNLADDVTDLFADSVAESKNDRFFCPDSISFSSGISIQASGDSNDTTFDGSGWSISIHGNGYFYPWTLEDFRTRVISSPKLILLRETMNIRFGGRFVIPTPHKTLLNRRMIANDEGWVWIGSESY